MEEFKDLDDVRTYVRTCVEDARDYVIGLGMDYSGDSLSMRNIMAAQLEDLPKYINVEGNSQKVLQMRLQGEEPDMLFWLDILSNTTFDSEQYKSLGENDGTIQTLVGLANALGMRDESERAYEALYSE